MVALHSSIPRSLWRKLGIAARNPSSRETLPLTASAMIWKPHVTVAALVEREGRFLMVEEEVDGAIVYNQPAGHLEQGESLTEAVIRETLEETGWHFLPTALVSIYRWMKPADGGTYLRFCFAGQCERHDPARPLDTGILRAVWMTPDELRQIAPQLRSPMVLRCIDDYLAGHRHPLDLLADL